MFARYNNYDYIYMTSARKKEIMTTDKKKTDSTFMHDNRLYFKEIHEEELSDIYEAEIWVTYHANIPDTPTQWKLGSNNPMISNNEVALVFAEGILPGWDVLEKNVCCKAVLLSEVSSAKVVLTYKKKDGKVLENRIIEEISIDTSDLVKYIEKYRFSDKAKQTYRHACFRSVQEAQDAITNSVNMLSSKQINTNIQKTVLNHVKTPHSVSRPMIFKENNNYYLASFIFFFTKEDIEQGRIKRPTMWALFDLVAGELIEERHSNEIDFSNAPYDITYDIRKNTHHRLSKDYYDKVFDILDSCRRKLIYENKFDEQEYRQYLDAIMVDVPDEYKRFYNDLSI